MVMDTVVAVLWYWVTGTAVHEGGASVAVCSSIKPFADNGQAIVMPLFLCVMASRGAPGKLCTTGPISGACPLSRGRP